MERRNDREWCSGMRGSCGEVVSGGGGRGVRWSGWVRDDQWWSQRGG